MNLTLTRHRFCEDGVFGALTDESGRFICVTLEHAYDVSPNQWVSKVPEGVFACVRGMHRLASMTEDFETFEITGVEGHTGLLFHAGNFNSDSSGCVLVGQEELPKMITRSRTTFASFIRMLGKVDSFTLRVQNKIAT